MVCPRTYDRDKVERDLFEWSKKDTSVNLCGFCDEFDLDPDVLLKWAKADLDGLGRTYRLAKARLGSRRELKLKNGDLHTKAYDLNAATYDLFLKEEKMAMLKYESDLSKEEKADEIKNINLVQFGQKPSDTDTPVQLQS